MPIPSDPGTLLIRPITVATLNTKASRGGGPPFYRFGSRALHPWGPSLAWARSKLGPLVTSTAELDRKPRDAR
jgi:hypothetical protein